METQPTMYFVINDFVNGGAVKVGVQITQTEDGKLHFTINEQGSLIGDLRGLFFDVANESLLSQLQITPTSTGFTGYQMGNDTVKDLGNGSNMNGMLGGTDGTDTAGYDVGISIGAAGIGKGDDFQSFSFILSTKNGTALDLSLLSEVNFGARLTSVGVVNGTRADSSKLLEITQRATDAHDDFAILDENNIINGNIFDNDAKDTGVNTIKSWSGGEFDKPIDLYSDGLKVGTLTVRTDGSYVVDTSTADPLSKGETITFDFDYTIHTQNETTAWSEDSAKFTVVVNGTNDAPDANDDVMNSIMENGTISGDVSVNDSDVDRLDTHTFSLVEGSHDGKGELTFNPDGTWSFDTKGQYDHLNTGQTETVSFKYLMDDGNGGTSEATVSFDVVGVSPPPPPPKDVIETLPDSYPDFAKDISHSVFVFDQAEGDKNGDGYYTVKIDGITALTDLDLSVDQILAWLVENDQFITTDSVFLGSQLKAGSVGAAENSYDDYWANDGDSSYSIDVIDKDNGRGTTTEWTSDDTVPVDVSQPFQNQVDQTYQYNLII